MKKSDRIKRLVAFYMAVALYLILLPILLSYSLGYKIDFRTFRIYKTGIIYLESSPSGASIYMHGKKHYDITPARIENLKPGMYSVGVEREGFYPWQGNLLVRPNMVTKADDIVLFLIPKEMNKIGGPAIVDFAISDKNVIYYMAPDGLYKSGMDGSGIKKISGFSDWPHPILGKRFSPDGEKFLYFDSDHIWAVYLIPDKAAAKNGGTARVEEVVKSQEPILDAFWYSTSSHIVFITEKEARVVEASKREVKNITTIYRFADKPRGLYYDRDNDSLYFEDMESGQAFEKHVFLYRLDLRQKFFDQFMKRLKKEFEYER